MFRQIAGEAVNTVEFGSGDTTIVGLAGAFGNVEIWQQPFERLHRRFRTIAYDHFGTGETYVASEKVTFDEQVALVEQVLDAFDVDRCVLAGDSSLCAVAAAATSRWPERVDGLVLVAGKIDHRPDESTIRFVEGLRDSFERTLGWFVEVCLPEDDAGHLRRWLRDIIARAGPERAATLVESFYDVRFRHMLPSIEVPALVLHGDTDRINPIENAQELADELPDARLEILEDTGHVPTLSRPSEVAGAIAGFVEQLT